MRRTNIGLAAAALATTAAVTAVPVQATTARTSISDPTGDANGLDARFYGAPGPTDTQNDATSKRRKAMRGTPERVEGFSTTVRGLAGNRRAA